MYHISETEKGIIRYPLHKHTFCEIMLYTEGVGYLCTKNGNIPFNSETAIIVPKNIRHGSVSENGFKNISIGGDFENLLLFETPVAIKTTAESRILAELVLKNKYSNDSHLLALINCYISSLMQSYDHSNQIDTVLNRIINSISANALDSDFNVTALLADSGYAEDYIRAKFKEKTAKTPVGFMHQVRIENACKLLDIYGKDIRITDLSEKCGFSDPVYFSRVFKSIKHISPLKYTKKHEEQR